MKIRTKNDLKDVLDKDLAWRRQELSEILSNVNKSKDKALNLAIRTAILLLYAHWEGFIKNAAQGYLNFVKYQNLKLNQLNANFLAIALKQKIQEFENTNKSTIHSQFVVFFRNCLNENANINHENVISAKSNLNSEILKQILSTIGIDYSFFELKENLIDAQLLNYRNTIAHGEHLKIDQKEYIIIHNEISNMIVEVKNRIENAAFLNSHLTSTSPMP